MPKSNLYINVVASFVSKHNVNATLSDIQRTARVLQRRSAPKVLTPDMEVVLGRVFGLPDPTPRAAFRDISDNDHAAALRLGLIGAGA